MYVNVVFVIRGLYSAVSLTLVREQRFIRFVISSSIMSPPPLVLPDAIVQ